MNFAIKLEQLHLQNNRIQELPHLKLENINKLHLENNEITFITGLETFGKLSELFISNQLLPSFTPLEFDLESLNAISRSLTVLDVSGNNITVLSTFQVLFNLRIFTADNNNVSDIEEVQMILQLNNLVELSLIDNPVCEMKKYRDNALAASNGSLEMLDNKLVHPHQQVAIRGLVKHRNKLEGRD